MKAVDVEAIRAWVDDDDICHEPRTRDVLRYLLGTIEDLRTQEAVRATGFAEKFAAAYDDARSEQMKRAWCNQTRDEKRARIGLVLSLSRTLDAIRMASTFSIRLGEAAIEAVIEGDWRMVKEWAEHFAFAEELPPVRERYAPLWEPFVGILRAELERRGSN